MIGRLLRRALHRLIRTLVRVRILAGALAAILVIGLAVWMFQSGSTPSFSLGLPSVKREPSATENYLKGNQSYNAELMWNSLSDDAIERFRARGRTLQDMQRQLEVARDSGSKLEEFNYVGGYGLPDGTSLQFYVVAMRGPVDRSAVEYVTYIFTLDRAGKITKVQ